MYVGRDASGRVRHGSRRFHRFASRRRRRTTEPSEVTAKASTTSTSAPGPNSTSPRRATRARRARRDEAHAARTCSGSIFAALNETPARSSIDQVVATGSVTLTGVSSPIPAASRALPAIHASPGSAPISASARSSARGSGGSSRRCASHGRSCCGRSARCSGSSSSIGSATARGTPVPAGSSALNDSHELAAHK